MAHDAFYGALETRNIDYVRVGCHEYQTWYGNLLYFGNDCKTLGFQYATLENKRKKLMRKPPPGIWLDKLFVCEHCFKYTDDEESMAQHTLYCKYAIRFPGRVKYKDPQYTIRKIKGSRYEMFCQNLCLFAKLFLDNKSVFFSVENFDFYVVYGQSHGQQVPMGYFSKEVLQCFDENNLGCICVFPPFQKRKLGTLLILFSYELSRFQGLISGPEHPLSTFGKVSYVRFWSKQLAYELTKGKLRDKKETSIDDISRATGFRQEDVMVALENIKCLVSDSNAEFSIARRKVEKWIEETHTSLEPVLDPSCLILD